MNVKIQGIEWKLSSGISIDEFYKYLESISGREEKSRVFAICPLSGFWAGVFLTIKNTTAYCQIKKDGRKFVITPKELEDGASMVDFNFFILHQTTGKGLYQYYNKSASANTFSLWIKKRFNELKKQRIKSEIDKLGGEDAISPKDRKKIMSKYKGIFKFSTLVRPEAFEDYVRTLKNIKNFAYEISTLDYRNNDKVALHELADRKSYKLFFSKDTVNVSKIKQEIVKMKPSENFKRATIVGADDDDQDAVYKSYSQ